MSNDLTPLDAALRYANLGWRVIPVKGKRPLGDDWPNRATSDLSDVAGLFNCDHDGVGVLLGERSGLIDFDCDSQEAEETIAKLFDGIDIETPCFQSSRGRHYLFQWTDRLPVGSIKIVVDGLEIRLGSSDRGAQSVLPPSGGRSWIIDPGDCKLAVIPDVVIERINARYEEQRKPKVIRQREAARSSGGGAGDGALNVPKWLSKHGVPIRWPEGLGRRYSVVYRMPGDRAAYDTERVDGLLCDSDTCGSSWRALSALLLRDAGLAGTQAGYRRA